MPLVPCPSCGKEISSRATQCKHCFEFVVQVPAPRVSSLPDRTTSDKPVVQVPMNFGERAVKRYRDAYVVARAIDAQGQSLKGLAVFVAVVIAIGVIIAAIAAARVSQVLILPMLIIGGIVAALSWSTIHARGVSVAAEGQHLLAALDTAVHTSPFLSDTQRAETMSL